MTEHSNETYSSPRPVLSERLRGQAVFIDTSIALPPDDELNVALGAAGISGNGVLDVESEGQRYALINVSGSPSTEMDSGQRRYRPFADQVITGEGSARSFILSEDKPFLIVHLAADGTVRGLPLQLGNNEVMEGCRFSLRPADGTCITFLDHHTNGPADRGNPERNVIRYVDPIEQKVSSQTEISPESTAGSDRSTDPWELVRRPEFLPVRSVEVGGRTFSFSPLVRSPGERDHAIMYSHIEKDGEQVTVPRLLYKSNSDGGWRVAYSYDNSRRLYIKRFNYKGSSHYVQETKLVPEIVDELERSDIIHDSNGALTQDIYRIFDNTSAIFDETNTAPREISYYEDLGLDPAMRPLRSIMLSGSLIDITRDYLERRGFASVGEYLRSFDTSLKSIPGFIPDFSESISVLSRQHTLLGPITIENYPAKYGEKDIVWSVARDATDRVWIDNIHLREALVSSYGTYATIFDGGLLTLKPLDFAGQVPAVNYTDEGRVFGDDYTDITPLLRNLLSIRRYLDAKSIR